jgi:DNA sulfur modification protein DndE
LDLWLCALIVDGNLKVGATIEEFRGLVESHWSRGFDLIREELEACEGNEIKLVQRLADLLPEGGTPVDLPFGAGSGAAGEIRLKVGTVSTTHPGGKEVDFVINGPGTPPHIALMGAIGKGKTTTGVQIALDLVRQARIPLLFIDPKGEFVADGQVTGLLAELGGDIQAIEMGSQPCLLDFLPPPDASTQKIARASMRLRDTIALCCKSAGDLQKDLLRTAIQDVIANGNDHSLETIRDTYEQQLVANGKGPDSIVSRLNELTGMNCFDPRMPATQFFSQSWVISLKGLPEELKRLSILMIMDAASSFLLDQEESPAPGGFRVLRHLLILDEARKVLQEKKSESLVDLIRLGRSKGSVVMLLSQDPSDFDGAADDFLSQIRTVVAFACAQSSKGLRSLEGVFGRKVQAQEFSDTYLTPGVAFVKLPGRDAERMRCWQPEN